MRELVVKLLTSLAESDPYVLLACALIGSFWLARSVVHKLRLFTQHVTKELRGGKSELDEWAGDLSELKRELTKWKSDPRSASGRSPRRAG